MKKLLLLLPLVLMLSGCGLTSNNQEVVNQKEICIKWWMDYSLRENWFWFSRVTCIKPTLTQ